MDCASLYNFKNDFNIILIYIALNVFLYFFTKYNIIFTFLYEIEIGLFLSVRCFLWDIDNASWIAMMLLNISFYIPQEEVRF